MIRDFLLWWWRQIFSLLPQRFITNHVLVSDLAIISPFGEDFARPLGIDILRRSGDATMPIGRFSLDDDGLARARQEMAGLSGQSILALPPGLVLSKTLHLPDQVERDLDQVLRYQMDEETPFTPDEVFWIWTVVARDRVAKRIEVRLDLVPKKAIAPLADYLAGQGIAIRALSAAGPDGGTLILPVLDPDLREPSPVWLRPRLFWGLSAGLAAALLVCPFLLQSLAFARVEARIAASQDAAGRASAAEARLDGTADGGGDVMAERARLADPLSLLAALTAVLPEDTYLTDLSLKGWHLSMVGQSAGATRLIGILAADGRFSDPSFNAPVTRLGNGADAPEGFSIAADVRVQP